MYMYMMVFATQIQTTVLFCFFLNYLREDNMRLLGTLHCIAAYPSSIKGKGTNDRYQKHHMTWHQAAGVSG